MWAKLFQKATFEAGSAVQIESLLCDDQIQLV